MVGVDEMAFDLAISAYFQWLLLLVFGGRSRFVKGVTTQKTNLTTEVCKLFQQENYRKNKRLDSSWSDWLYLYL